MFSKLIEQKLLVLYVFPFIVGSLSFLSFQPFNYSFINFVIFPILFLLLSYVNKKSKNIYRKKPYLFNLFLIGYFFGIGFFLSGTHWISYSLTFDPSFKILLPFSIILLPLTLGLFFGLAALFSGPFLKSNFTSILIFSASFGFFDYIRGNILSGFPWNLWAYSWSWFTEIIQILNPIGLYAFNLLTITIFCLPSILFFKKHNNKILTLFFLISIFLSSYIYGSYTINNNDKLINNKKNEEVYIKVVSPGFDLKYNLSEEELLKLLKKLIKYSEPQKDKKTIFIWPEGVFSGYYFSDIKKFKKIIKENFSKKHLVIFGINTKKNDKFFNSMMVINSNFDPIHKYNKKKLVPFGEFLPFEKYLNNFGLKKITQGYGSFSNGENQKNFSIGNIHILPLICYEIIFPKLVQKSKKNTNLIINISEDAWFGESIGPHQHLAKAIFRSIESNTFLIRSANKGHSAIINNRGQILKSLKPREIGNIEMKIPLVNQNKNKNKNDLIFFILLITYMLIFFTIKKINNDKK
jgi:apolipoprotein N-acyltransferase